MISEKRKPKSRLHSHAITDGIATVSSGCKTQAAITLPLLLNGIPIVGRYMATLVAFFFLGFDIDFLRLQCDLGSVYTLGDPNHRNSESRQNVFAMALLLNGSPKRTAIFATFVARQISQNKVCGKSVPSPPKKVPELLLGDTRLAILLRNVV